MKRVLTCILIMIIAAALGGCSSDDSVSDNMGIIDLDNMSVNGKGVEVDGKNINITSGGEYSIFGNLNDGMIYVGTSDSVILTIDNANITNSNGPAIYIEDADKATIKFVSSETSYIASSSDVDGKDAAIHCDAELSVEGIGSAKIVSKFGNGIESTENITIYNAACTIESGKHGINTDKLLHILSGYMSIYANEGNGLKAEKGLTIDGGNISLMVGSEGMESKGTLTVNGGNINIESLDDGINTGSPDSEKEAFNEDDRRDVTKVDSEFAKAHSITLNGGVLFIKTEGDGIDSNGDLAINGGKVIIDGPSARDDGSLDCDGAMTISGGMVFAISDGGMVQLPRSGDGQKTVCLDVGKQKQGSVIEIKDGDGILLMEHTANRDFSALIFSHNKLKEDNSYKVFVDGSLINVVESDK